MRKRDGAMDKAEFILMASKRDNTIEYTVHSCGVLAGDKISFNNMNVEPVAIKFKDDSPFLTTNFTVPAMGELVLPVKDEAEAGSYPFTSSSDGLEFAADEVRVDEKDHDVSISFVFRGDELLAGCNVFAGSACIFRVAEDSKKNRIQVTFKNDSVLLRPDGTPEDQSFVVKKNEPKTLYVDDFLEMESFAFDVGPDLEELSQQTNDEPALVDEIDAPVINPSGAKQGDLLIIPR
jgi:hypothetical protein